MTEWRYLTFQISGKIILLLLGTKAFETNNLHIHKSKKTKKQFRLDERANLWTLTSSCLHLGPQWRLISEGHPRTVKMSGCKGGWGQNTITRFKAPVEKLFPRKFSDGQHWKRQSRCVSAAFHFLSRPLVLKPHRPAVTFCSQLG